MQPPIIGSPQFRDLADPTVLVDNGAVYLFGTTNFQRLPVARVNDLDTGKIDKLSYGNAMPVQPGWTDGAGLWAPTVGRFASGYVMFFGGTLPNPPDPQNPTCVGRATASSPTGPFTPDPEPFTCGSGPSGALDPSIFVDADGSAWLLFSRGGSLDDLWSMPLTVDGNAAGPAALIMKRPDWEGYFTENPSMVVVNGQHYLAFSAGNWKEASYRTGLAKCDGPQGPCVPDPGPWVASTGGRVGPGGLDFFRDPAGVLRAILHSYQENDVGTIGKRDSSVARLPS